MIHIIRDQQANDMDTATGKKPKYQVIFLPSGMKTAVEEGVSILEAAHAIHEPIESVCGHKISCGKCKVRILEGAVDAYGILSGMAHISPVTDTERLFAEKHSFLPNERLACDARIYGDIAVFIPEESRVRKMTPVKAAGTREIEISPAIHKYFLTISNTYTTPSKYMEYITAELHDRFGLNHPAIDRHVLSTLPDMLQKNTHDITVTVWDSMEIIHVEPGHIETSYGIAIDIGTTSVAAYLCDLTTGAIIADGAILNPQVTFGEDVMSRIAYAQKHDNGLAKLNRAIISGLNNLIADIASQAKVKPADISEAVVVGNTVMHHIFHMLDIIPLGRLPFKPSRYHSMNVKARSLGLDILPSANVHTLPVEAGFVGADNVGVLIAEEPYKQDNIHLIIDIGTNGELVLGNSKRLLSCSCATGPAFEGASIKFGMRAANGAIDKVRIDKNTRDVRFTVIGNPAWNNERDPGKIQAVGICGSGIIDAVAEMAGAGIIKQNGSIDKTLDSPRLQLRKDGKPEFVIAWAKETAIHQDITVTQEDIRAIQLAKAALYAGARIMMRKLGITAPDKIILAGAFGTVIDRERALSIGMFPDGDLEKIIAAGNAAGDGACIALLNKGKRVEADKIAREVEYIELTTEPDFQDIFIAATHFPGS